MTGASVAEAANSAEAATRSRLDGLRPRLEQQELDGILISNEHNRRYFSGFKGTAGFLVISGDAAVLATDFRYTEQAALQATGFEIERIRARMDWLPALAEKLGLKKLGFEADDVTVSLHQRMQTACSETAGDGEAVELVATSGIGAELRAVKDDGEVALLARAIEIGDEALDEVSDGLEPGLTEAEVAWRIEMAVRERGAEGLSFETIVASGPNGARPHHLAGERVLAEGEPIVIDMGCSYQGYCSDLTRTVFLGEADDEFKKIYDVVHAAQRTAIETLESGMTGAEADALARVVIEESGYGEAFGHSMGHGIGLEVHEDPGVGPTSKNKLRDGMVFTVEPGIYLTGKGGVRIEDVVVLENGRPRVMSKARKTAP